MRATTVLIQLETIGGTLQTIVSSERKVVLDALVTMLGMFYNLLHNQSFTYTGATLMLPPLAIFRSKIASFQYSFSSSGSVSSSSAACVYVDVAVTRKRGNSDF